jgi:hypothetical protein
MKESLRGGEAPLPTLFPLHYKGRGTKEEGYLIKT